MPERFLDRGGGWVLGQSVLMLAGVILGPGVNSGPWAPWTGFASLVLLVAGGAVGVAGAMALKYNRTIFPKPKQGSRLIQAGIYRWVRHPLYTSLMLLSAGWGLLWCSPLALLIGGVLALFLNAKAAREERWLREQFPDYAEYERRVRRFVPRMY